MFASRTVPCLKQVVLNDVFTAALNQAKQKPVQLPHNQQVSLAWLVLKYHLALHRHVVDRA